jgi:ferric-dicitrate binding protein FerR (iron transport regulator)
MNVKEAQQVVADYSKGEFDPVRHAVFMRWAREASARDLEVVADEYESHSGQWVFPLEEPPPRWVQTIEDRLDRMAGRGRKPSVVAMRFAGKMPAFNARTLVAAASVTLLIVAGTLFYHQSGVSPGGKERRPALDLLTRTVAVARGGMIRRITLPDGSQVWLNFGSTLKYPPAFNGAYRVVALSGEAYFAISQHSDMPFRVLTRDARVEVLGTHFDIMAYEDEPVTQASLIDGSIKFESGVQRVTLHPGEQAEIAHSSVGTRGPVRIIPGIDPGAVVAWKDGTLAFENTGLHQVLRVLERCYALEVQVDQDVPDTRITGRFSREEGFDGVLKQLEREHLRFVKSGKTVRVMLAK